MLHILLRVIEARLRQRSRRVGGRLGAVTFVQRFGSALNAHVHFDCCVIDGVFAGGEDGQVHLAEADAVDMAGWDHGGGFQRSDSVTGAITADSSQYRYADRKPLPIVVS